MNSIIKDLPRIFFGESKESSLERKVFITASFVTLLSGFLGIIWNIFLDLPVILNLLLGVLILVYFALYFNARFRNSYNPLAFVLISLLFLSLLYILNGGLNGSIPSLYIVFILIFITISSSKNHLLILLLTLANLLGLFVAEQFFLRNLIYTYVNNETREADLMFGYIICLILCYIVINYFKRSIISKNKQLAKLNESKDLFFNIIAHDLRAPISNILGLTDIMMDKTESHSSDNFQKYSEIVNKESVFAVELLESLMEWGKIQMNKVQIDPQTVNLGKIASEVVDVFKEKCVEKEIEIGIQIPPEIYVLTDLNALKTIFRNLVSNAIKFTPNGGNIAITAEDFNLKYIKIVITDNGIGMDTELIENLFHLHMNTNRKGTAGEVSNGLGLIIIKELIEKQGGELMIESHNNKGSTFKFTVLKSDKKVN